KGLPGSGLRGCQQISAAERDRDCVALYWRGGLKVVGGKSLLEILRNGELRKIRNQKVFFLQIAESRMKAESVSAGFTSSAGSGCATIGAACPLMASRASLIVMCMPTELLAIRRAEEEVRLQS